MVPPFLGRATLFCLNDELLPLAMKKTELVQSINKVCLSPLTTLTSCQTRKRELTSCLCGADSPHRGAIDPVHAFAPPIPIFFLPPHAFHLSAGQTNSEVAEHDKEENRRRAKVEQAIKEKKIKEDKEAEKADRERYELKRGQLMLFVPRL